MFPVSVYLAGTAVALLLGFILKLFVRWDDKFKQIARLIPGPPPVPIFGNTFQFMVSSENLLPLFDKWVLEYGHRLIYRVGTYWIVALSNPTDIEKLLTSTTETVKSVDYEQLIPWLGTGLLISNREKWAKRRKLLTPSFHFKILEKFLDVFNQQSFKFVNITKQKYRTGESFDVAPLISKMALDIICETAMGVKIGAQELDEDSEYIRAITRIKWLQQYRAFRPWLEPSFIWNTFSYGKEESELIKILHGFTNSVIQQRKSEYLIEQSADKTDEEKGKKAAFLDLLLEALRSGQLQSDEDVREETDTFMFEGHDTVSSSIAFTLFLLGNHSEIQEKVHEELSSVFGDDATRAVTLEDLAKLKYLECCIKESLRLCPSVPIIARNIQNDFELDKNVILPPETLVLVLPYQLHRNSTIYADPLEYRPERFFHENSSGRHPFSFVPFSAGKRNCIGQKFALMEEKVIIANILRNFTIRSLETLGELTILSDLIIHSKNGINIKYYTK